MRMGLIGDVLRGGRLITGNSRSREGGFSGPGVSGWVCQWGGIS